MFFKKSKRSSDGSLEYPKRAEYKVGYTPKPKNAVKPPPPPPPPPKKYVIQVRISDSDSHSS